MSGAWKAALAPVEIDVVERVLSDGWGVSSRVEQAEAVWGRPHIVRVVTSDGRGAFVKRPRAPRVDERDVRNFAAEWSALDFLSQSAEAVAPRLLGGDWEQRLMVIEELPPGRSLAASLLGDDALAAASDLVAYGEALGRLHVWSMDHRAGYATCRAARGLADSANCGWAQTLDSDARSAFVVMIDEIGISTRGLAAELDDMYEVLFGGDFLALVHGDPCPDNVRIVDQRCYLFDFEVSGMGCASLDASYLLAPFPSCWCFAPLPVAVAAVAMDAYRRVLDGGGVNTGPGWEDALQAALGCWVVARSRLYRQATSDDRSWGTTTMRPRLIAWARALAETRAGRFPQLSAAAASLAEQSDESWPAAQLPHFPAFATGTPIAEIPSWWNESPN
jgi:Ser/Thr protein kinase RdoA (MazF antagonist)